MDGVAEKNRQSWDAGADSYSTLMHSEKFMQRILEDPANAFHRSTWEMIRNYVPDIDKKRICVPSSGDNHAVFAFAMLGAQVTSCDISGNQLINAEKIARQYSWGQSIEFVCADTMKLKGLADDAYDFVYTSNGVHVWIDDLPGMYRNIRRIMKPGGMYIMYEIHPFGRPFDDRLNIEKPYDMTGPFETEYETTFHWRIMDIMNAMLDSGLKLQRVEEMADEKDYDWPFWISLQDLENGVTATHEEVDRRYDWHNNPWMALPNWLSIAAMK